ncbi:MAG: PorV/PorQ family protein [Elusimicrobia bacterium]|nr:PorV/PorQ family protein [Elusimicrobiota bacterium]
MQRQKMRAGLALAALLACLCAAPAGAARIHPSAGTTSAAFLKLGVGARAVALGGAFTAVPGDPYSVYWNPAGLAALEGEKNIGFFHNNYFQGLGQEFLYYTAPASGLKIPFAGRPRRGVYGLGLDYFYTPKDMERRSGLYEADPVNPISPVEGKFGAYDLAFSAAYGWRYSAQTSLGAAVKVIRQSIDTKSGSSAALDLGVLREFDWNGGAYTAGLVVQNLGPGIKFTDRRYDLPLVFKAGVSRALPGSGVLLALEADKPVDNYPSFALGVEYRLTQRMTLRTAYRYRAYGNELGPWSGFSAGAGVAFDRLSFDYAFTPFGDLGNSHRFSINFRFGGAQQAERRKARTAAPALENARRTEFRVEARTLTISGRGVKYEVKASAASGWLRALTFKTLVRGPVDAGLRVADGALPPSLSGGFPEGAEVLRAFELPPLPGMVQGDAALDFKIEKDALGGRAPALFYRVGDVWREAGLSLAGEDEVSLNYSAAVQAAQYYAVAVKK